MGLLRYLFTPLGLVLVGLIAGAAGISMAMAGRDGKVPERTELTKVSGTVQNITKKWKEKYGTKRDVKYEIEITGGNAASVKVTVPEKHLSERQAETLISAPVTVLVRDNNYDKVWELSAGKVMFIDYAKSREEHVQSLASQAENGPYLAGGGVFLVLVGATWFFRRRTSDATA